MVRRNLPQNGGHDRPLDARGVCARCDELGLSVIETQTEADTSLTNDILDVMYSIETDMTIFYRRLASLPLDGTSGELDVSVLDALTDAYYRPEQLTMDYRATATAWLQRYRDRVRLEGISDADRLVRMNAVNPKYVLRNYMAQLAIDKADLGDYSLISDLLELLRHPCDEQSDKEQFAAKRPDWARERAGCSMLSCSS